VDIGTLCIHDPEPRETFDQREQEILLNLANMLVYQLTTLVSCLAVLVRAIC
jgi:GAF domain-containing protein